LRQAASVETPDWAHIGQVEKNRSRAIRSSEGELDEHGEFGAPAVRHAKAVAVMVICTRPRHTGIVVGSMALSTTL
jgi:hypothetical protein